MIVYCSFLFVSCLYDLPRPCLYVQLFYSINVYLFIYFFIKVFLKDMGIYFL